LRLRNCYRTNDFRELARQRLPSPIFHYSDGGSDDEVTLARNTSAFEAVDLVPNVLAGVGDIDMSVSVLGQRLEMPLFFAPTAMQRLFHHCGEHAIAQAAQKYGTMFGVSTIGTRSIEELGAINNAAKMFQIYVHNDAGLTKDLIDRCKAANFGAMEKFDLPNISSFIEAGSKTQSSIVDYLNTEIKRTIDWDDAASMIEEWGGPFAIKGIMSVDDAKRSVEAGASAIMISNHGGRQLDGSRAPFDQLQAILDAVGGDIEVIVDGGIRRGTHVLKALAMGATACSGGRMYLYALAGAGPAGVDRAMGLLKDEIERDMLLMGCSSIGQLTPSMIATRT
jgi:L-lactate dehydrogenase (cytochrome)